MGKGGGNVCGKVPSDTVDPVSQEAAKASPAPAPVAAQEQKTVTTSAQAVTQPVVGKATKKTKIFIIYYSTYGHIQHMAEKVKEGVEKVKDCEVTIYQVAEGLPASVLEKMHAPPKAKYPIITADKLTEADGFIFGFPTRFGMMCYQMKAFFDTTGELWQKGALVGKTASLFTSTGVINGGQETTLLTAVTQLAHHGMIYVPVGFGLGAGLFDVEVARGGSAYGAGVIAGPTGARQASPIEVAQCVYLGQTLATAAKKLSA